MTEAIITSANHAAMHASVPPEDLLAMLAAVIQSMPDPAPADRRASAVLIPLVEVAGDLQVILTQRSTQLRHHAGQISFPGGAIDADESVEAAALREAHEEINLNPMHVDILGHLPGVLTTANFHIAPVLGLVKGQTNLIPHPDEVERILFEKIHPLLMTQNHRQEPRQYQGKDYKTWVINHDNEYIWGATAKLIVQWSGLLPAEVTAPFDKHTDEGAA